MGAMKKPDFSGYVTKSGIKCSDGRTILKDAFKHQDGEKVPLIWQHEHGDPELVLGHVVLEHREDGVYGYGYFNGNAKATASKELIEHEDIVGMSIFATQLNETAKQVAHGMIREVSLVLARANPGAMIKNLQHDEGDHIVYITDEAHIFHDIAPGEFLFGDRVALPGETVSHAADEDENGKTAQEVYDSLDEDQQKLLHGMIAEAYEEGKANADTPSGDGEPPKKGADGTAQHNDDNDGKELKHMTGNLFERAQRQRESAGAVPGHMLAHDGISMKHQVDVNDLHGIMKHAEELGSLKAAVEAYAIKHSIDNIDLLFPDARAVEASPQFDKRRTEWVAEWLNSTSKSPFSRWKVLVADITEDEARARGYITGNYKKGEFFGLIKRTTGPKTVYKKQDLDRDDILDITDFDVVAWLKIEMRIMLDEELAVAALIGDGRDPEDEDKIPDPAGAPEGNGIRSVLHDHDLYAVKVNVNIDDPNSSPEEIVDAIVEKMQFYKGSGSPNFYTTQLTLTRLLLAKDGIGRRLYRTKSELADAMMVKDIIPVEPFEREANLVGIILNPTDYKVGVDRGGEVTFFSDFSIDYNKEKYLLETRMSGGLQKIRSALVITKVDADADVVVAEKPGFNRDTGVITIPAVTGVTYHREDTGATVAAGAMAPLAEGKALRIYAVANAGSYFETTAGTSWLFRRAVPAPS